MLPEPAQRALRTIEAVDWLALVAVSVLMKSSPVSRVTWCPWGTKPCGSGWALPGTSDWILVLMVTIIALLTGYLQWVTCAALVTLITVDNSYMKGIGEVDAFVVFLLMVRASPSWASSPAHSAGTHANPSRMPISVT